MAERSRNIYMDMYSAAFRVHQQAKGIADPAPYLIQTKDGVQLAALLKKGDEHDPPWPITVERWERGIKHYFLSNLGERTIADLASRFSTFWAGPLDRYGKPPEKASRVGSSNPSPSLVAAYAWHPKFLHAAFNVAQKTKAFDAIDELFEQISAGLSETEAFKRLKEIEQGE